MRARTTWILLVLLILVAAWFFAVEEPRRRATERSGRSGTIFPYGPEEVDRFSLRPPGGELIVMERSGEEWIITSPVVTPGQRSMIDLVLDQVVPGRKLEEFDGVYDFAPYGLDDPFATVILFNDRRGRVDTVRVGDTTPTGPRAYVRVNDEHAVLITRDLMHNAMRKNLFHLRDKNLFHVIPGDISAITVNDGNRRLSFAREAGGWWRTGPRYRVESSWMDAYAKRLSETIIRSFDAETTDSLDRFGLRAPGRRLFIDGPSGIVSISIGRVDEETVHVLRDGLDKVVSIRTSDILPIFEVDPEGLRSRRLAFFDPNAAHLVRWTSPDTTVALRGGDGAWVAPEAGDAAVRGQAVFSLLDDLRRTRFDGFLDDTFESGASFLDPLAVEIVIEDADGRLLDRIRIATPLADHEIGGSLSSDALGRLPVHTAARLRRRFESIGAGLMP
ncbi:MAG: DUF4340 domain-containing protein [Candidatus Krumholzibacteriota bacterium]|nr:DUF4340 domain-containing protein [Candidatus Krumholzibacteriota bacterium]